MTPSHLPRERPHVEPDLRHGVYNVGPKSEVGPGQYRIEGEFEASIRRQKGPSMGMLLPSREDIDAAIGVGPSTTPAPGGLTRVPSFAWEGRSKGVEFGHKLKSPRTILLNIGYPLPPGTRVCVGVCDSVSCGCIAFHSQQQHVLWVLCQRVFSSWWQLPCPKLCSRCGCGREGCSVWPQAEVSQDYTAKHRLSDATRWV